jgi:transcriptional regulator with XRE-family HTH domain
MHLRPGLQPGLAEQLVRQRTRLGLSQKEFAEHLGVDPSTLAKWEQGRRDPAGAFLARVKRLMRDGEVSGVRRGLHGAGQTFQVALEQQLAIYDTLKRSRCP